MQTNYTLWAASGNLKKYVLQGPSGIARGSPLQKKLREIDFYVVLYQFKLLFQVFFYQWRRYHRPNWYFKRRHRVVLDTVVSPLISKVEGNSNAPFSIATTPRCRESHNSFPWIAPLYPWYVLFYCWVLNKEVSSTIFKVFDMTRLGIEPRSPGPSPQIRRGVFTDYR